MDTVLSPNEVLSCLWNKSAREKCRIGLADVVMYERLLPSKWYFTGKTGEVLRKKSISSIAVSERWKKIARSTNSNIMAILRQEDGLLKFFHEGMWDKWMDIDFSDVDASVLSLHCFVRGNSNLVYRNFFELKDNFGKFVTSTRSYKLVTGDDSTPVTMMSKEDYEFTELKAANIKSVMDLATSTVIKYLEMMLQTKVRSIYVDYVIDQKSQLWLLWTSEARLVHKELSMDSQRLDSQMEYRESVLEGANASAAAQVDSTINFLRDSQADTSMSSRIRSSGEDNSAGFKVLPLDESKAESSSASRCKGDFCHVTLQSVGSLASHKNAPSVESFFTEEEQNMLNEYERYKSLSVPQPSSDSYDYIPMKSILLAREERRGKQALDNGMQDTWRDYPTSPRDANVFSAMRAKERRADKSREEGSNSEAERLANLANAKAERETFNSGMLSYYDSVKVCSTCYQVYLLLDWARETLAHAKKGGKVLRKVLPPSSSALVVAAEKSSADVVGKGALVLTKIKREPRRQKKLTTWKNYSGRDVVDGTAGNFVDLDNYLRGGVRTVKDAPSSDVDVEVDEDRLYKGHVLVALNSAERAEEVAQVLRQSHFKVRICIDGRSLINDVIDLVEAAVTGDSSPNVDCILVQKDLNLADAFDVAKAVREFERSLRKNMSAELAADGVGALPKVKRVPVLCCAEHTSPEMLKLFMKADMDGCLSLPIDHVALLNTVRAAVPHHLALLTTRAQRQKVFRLGPMGIREGATDSSASAYKGLSVAKSKEDDCAFYGVAQLDADTLIPFIVMDSSRHSNLQVLPGANIFNLVVCHDLFDTAERLKIFLSAIVIKYPSMQVLLWNYPGQAFTEWRPEQLLNNEYHAICLNELLGQIGHLGTKDFNTSHPFYILGYGHGMSVASFYSAHYNIPNMRGIISVNGWSFLDSYMAGIMHDCINIFECAPPSRPDLPVYFFSRFLFSREYLAKASVPLALNIYTAVHNPISIKGRISLCKGVLQLVDTRPVLAEIDRSIICLQSTSDSFARPIHTEPFVANRGGEVKSIYLALQNSSKTCVVWMKSGHEVFQEKRGDMLTIIEQILTGFHELHNVVISSQDNSIAGPSLSHTEGVQALVPHENFKSAVEDRFINSVLHNVSRVKVINNHEVSSLVSPRSLSVSVDHSGQHRLTPLPDVHSSSAKYSTFSHMKHGKDDSTSMDPALWIEYSKGASETQLINRKVDGGKKGGPGLVSSEQLIVLDPTSVLFDKHDSVKKSSDPQKLNHKTNAKEFFEVKEFMSWRLKRNKRRLQRLQNASNIIQCAFRCHLARVKVTLIRRTKAARVIQRYFRGWLGRMKFLEHARVLWAVQMVQMYWRGYSARKRHFLLKLEIAAAVTIQKVFRGHVARRLVAAKRKRQYRAACIIQAMYRRMRARKDVFRLRLERNKATVIQRVYRGRLGRKRAVAELDKYIFSRSQTQGIEFGRQMLLEHKLHATKLQSDVALLAQEKAAAEELVEQLLEEISSFEEGVRTLEKDMHRLSKVGADAAAFMDDESKYELREQKMRLDKEFGSMLAKISNRKDLLGDLEKKLAMIDKFRLKKEEELRTLERKLVVLLEEQQSELNAIKRKQDVRANMLIASHDELAGAVASGNGGNSTALVLGKGGRGGGGGPSMQEKKQAAQLMQSTETLMKFGFMSMSMTYFSSLNMIKALRTVSAQDTVMAALADVHAQKAASFGKDTGASSGGSQGGGEKFLPDLKRGQLPGQEALRVSAWSVDDVSKWLDTLNLGQYKEAFIDAAIDGEFLYDLDEEDLKNTLGIEHRLHRKKILNFVQRLKVAEAQEDSKLDALLRETNAMDAPFIESSSPTRSFGAMDNTSVGSGAASGITRGEPKVSLAELVTMVRHSKYSQAKEALDFLQTKRFDPSNIESQYIPDHGTVYVDAYERVAFHINRGSEHNNSLLTIAAQNGNMKLVKYLLSKGANPNHQNDAGQSPAHFAIEYKFFEVSTWLFQNGGLDFLENKYGLTPYDGLNSQGGDDDSLLLQN